MTKKIYILFFILINFEIQAQTKIYKIKFAESSPIIDAQIESFWDTIQAATGFIQYQPFNGKPASKKTVVKLVYTKKALYILAINYDEPQKISSLLSPRDQIAQADWFGVIIDPFNNGRIAYYFIITAAGVQIDKKIIGTQEDYNWDAVWHSSVRKTNFGWIAEIKIPFSQLRFPNKKNQTWSINFIRNIQRKREISSWNIMDIKNTSIITQMGKIQGIKGIYHSIYLEFYPYFSFYKEKWSDKHNYAIYYNGGLDLKLNLKNSLTLDMMLIPDFGEVQSDDPILNLSPYETYYSEKRQFFTEGTEIFRLGNIFYSRRIGATPSKYSQIINMLNPNEIVINNPPNTQIINATKITGKTKSKISFGLLNALTDNTYAVVKDTITNNERQILTEPLSNYNIFAISKDFKHSSYLGFINTNKIIFSDNKFIANTSALEINLKDKKENYRLFLRTSTSLISLNNIFDTEIGYAYKISLSKTKGNIKFGISRNLYSDKYYINDLGYLPKNNIITHNAYLTYNIYKPFWILYKWKTSLSINHQALFINNQYISTNIKIESYGLLKNFASSGIRINLTPDKTYDYFEPRAENFVYIIPPMQNYMFWYSTDYTKKFSLDWQMGFYLPIEDKSPRSGGWALIGPRYRFGNWGLATYHTKIQFDQNNYGFVSISPDEDTVIFGQRNIRILENIFKIDISFSANTSLTVRSRHYWSLVKYLNYFTLNPDGQLIILPFSYQYTENQDKNFNIITIESIFKWQFLLGSEISIVYRRQLNASDRKIITDYFENIKYIYQNYPNFGSLMLKIVLFI